MATYVRLKGYLQKLSEIEIFRKSQDLGLILIWIINMCHRWYIWWCKQHSIIVAFRNKCWFCSFLFIHWCKNQDCIKWKNIICCWQTEILLKTSTNDAMLLVPSNIPSMAHVDNSNQNQSEILRFSKSLDFWQFLKTAFEPHICCHEYDLSIITNWQHIGRKPLW